MMEALEMNVYYGMFQSEEEFRQSDKELIVISASYDTFSVAPHMTEGINSLSGYLAVTDLARMFQPLNDDSSLKETAKYDLLFVLTPGSGADYLPTQKFLDALNAKILDRIKLVICLDQIGHHGPLTVFTGNTIDESQKEFAKHIVKALDKSAVSSLSESLNFKRKVVPSSFYEWEHIRYSEKSIFALTITSL